MRIGALGRPRIYAEESCASPILGVTSLNYGIRELAARAEIPVRTGENTVS